MDPTASGFYRLFIGGLTLLLVSQKGHRFEGWSFSIAALWGMSGLWLALDLICWHRSVQFIGPGLSTIMSNCQVFVLPLFGLVWFGEKITTQKAVALLFAACGLYFLVGRDFNSFDPQIKTGIFLGAATAVFYALYVVTLRSLQQNKDSLAPVFNLAISSLVGAAILALATYVNSETLRIPSLQEAGLLASYGILSQAIGWLLISRSLPHASIIVAGLCILLEPAFSMLWDVLFYGRIIYSHEAIGIIILFAAIVLISIGPLTTPGE